VKTTAIAACTVTFTLVATPALAAPYPVPNAKTELLAAIDATNAAASYQYLDNSLGWTAAFTLAGQYQQVTVGEQRVFNGVGNYHRIDWPSAAVEEKVTGPDYLDNLALQWELTDAASPYALDYFRQWIDIRTERLGPHRLTGQRQLHHGGRQVHLGNRHRLPRRGRRLLRVRLHGRCGRADHTARTHPRQPHPRRRASTRRGPTCLSQSPSPRPTRLCPSRPVRRAIQAATLNATIRSLARDSAKTGNRLRQNLRKLRVWTKEAVGLENAAGDGSQDEPIPRYVRIRVANVSGGVRDLPQEPHHRHPARVAHHQARRELEGVTRPCPDQIPVRPSTLSRMRSAWPLCRAYSAIMCR
jgi:hypothetical protein